MRGSAAAGDGNRAAAIVLSQGFDSGCEIDRVVEPVTMVPTPARRKG